MARTDDEFFFLRSSLDAVPRGSTPVKCTDSNLNFEDIEGGRGVGGSGEQGHLEDWSYL